MTQPDSDQSALFDPPDLDQQERMVEAILFATSEPLSTQELDARLPEGSDAAEAVRLLEKRYEGRGVAIVRIAGKWTFRTAPDLAHLLRREAKETKKLSRAAVETLAIVAYHQPVTRGEIEEIRGVSVSRGTLDLLLDLQWIQLGRRRQTPGRPITFVTSERFLEHFGLESVKDLPGLEELKAAGLLDDRPPPGARLPGLDDVDEDDSEEPELTPDTAQNDLF